MRRMLGAYVAGVLALTGVLVAAPASAADPTSATILGPESVTMGSPPSFFSVILDETPSCADCLTYEWDLDGDPVADFNDTVDPTHDFITWDPTKWVSEAGTYTLRVQVTFNATVITSTKSVTVTFPGSTDGFAVGIGGPYTTTTGLAIDLGLTQIHEQPDGSTLTYAWELDGDGGFDDSTLPSGHFVSATTGSFTVYVRVRHSQMAPGDPSAEASTTITVIPRVSLTTPVLPATAKAGQTLTPTGGVATPNDALRTWTWLRDGSKITTTSVPSYKLTTADSGRVIRVRVDATRSGYGDSYGVTSNYVRVAAACIVRPTFTGTTRVGRRLTGSKGTWRAPSHTFSYRWLRDGRPITGATRTTYTTTRADRGRLITFQVTAKRAGFVSVIAKSVARRIS